MSGITKGPWVVREFKRPHNGIDLIGYRVVAPGQCNGDDLQICEAYPAPHPVAVNLDNFRALAEVPAMVAALRDASQELQAWRNKFHPSEWPDKPVVHTATRDKIRAILSRIDGATPTDELEPAENGPDGQCLHCGRDNRGHEGEPCADDCPQYHEAKGLAAPTDEPATPTGDERPAHDRRRARGAHVAECEGKRHPRRDRSPEARHGRPKPARTGKRHRPACAGTRHGAHGACGNGSTGRAGRAGPTFHGRPVRGPSLPCDARRGGAEAEERSLRGYRGLPGQGRSCPISEEWACGSQLNQRRSTRAS